MNCLAESGPARMVNLLGCRLGLGEKLQLACTEKKGRAQAIQIDGASVMLPTGQPAHRPPTHFPADHVIPASWCNQLLLLL